MKVDKHIAKVLRKAYWPAQNHGCTVIGNISAEQIRLLLVTLEVPIPVSYKDGEKDDF